MSSPTIQTLTGFEARLPVPQTCPWPKLHVRAYAATESAEGVGLLTLEVTPAQP